MASKLLLVLASTVVLRNGHLWNSLSYISSFQALTCFEKGLLFDERGVCY
jgi:hypothetical protein